MKKIEIIVMVVCSLIILSSALAVEAVKPEDILEQKLEIVKSRIGDTDDFTDFNSSAYGTNSLDYSFTWQNEEKGDWMEVVINSEDIITYYYRSYDYEIIHKPSLEHKSVDEIVDAAKKFVYKLNPDLEGKLIFDTNEYADMYASGYEVLIYRIENGIKVSDNAGSVSLSKNLTDVRSFRLNYTLIDEFDSPAAIISKDDAVNAYINNLGYKLCYNIVYEDSASKAVLKYIPDYERTEYIDALSGNAFDYNDYKQAQFREETADMAFNNSKSMAGGGGSVGFSRAELSEMEKMENLISVETAEKMIRENEYLDIGYEAQLTHSKISRDYYNKNKYVYYFNFETGNEYCSVTSNAIDGEIISVSRYVDKDLESTEKISPDKLNTLAKNAVKALAGKYFTDDANNTFVYEETNGKYSTLNATRIVNGIECVNNGLSIRLDEFDGKIQYYNLNYSEVQFPEKSDAISADKAYDFLFANSDYMAVYIPVTDNDKNTTGKLVYDFNIYDIEIDAVNNRFYSALDASEKIIDYNDIDGHYAENIINKLKQFGVGFTGGEFKPDENIKQGEFVTLLSYVFHRNIRPIIYKSGMNYNDAYAMVKTYDWISEDEIMHEAPLTREDACVIMIKAMGSGDVARYEDIFISPFNDVKENIGYIAILNAMGVVNGDGKGNFNPDTNLTRADAMIILYNYLSN